MTSKPPITGKNRPYAVRDMEWVLTSPLLLAERPQPDLFSSPETINFLNNLRDDPSPLLEYLNDPPRQGLGFYFEQLVLFWLINLPSVTVLGSNIQIHTNKRTIGEFDVLFKHEGQAYHWELSVKFYLNIGTGDQEEHFVGPGLKDSLRRKLDRIYSHQLPLARQVDAGEALEKYRIQNLTSSAFMKGALFQPGLALPTQNPPLPNRVSRACCLNHWICLQDVASANLPQFEYFHLLDKRRWLTPYFLPDEVTAGSKVELSTALRLHFQTTARPVMACLFQSAGRNALTEIKRFFVVPDNWPDLAAEFYHRQEFGD